MPIGPPVVDDAMIQWQQRVIADPPQGPRDSERRCRRRHACLHACSVSVCVIISGRTVAFLFFSFSFFGNGPLGVILNPEFCE